MHQDEKDFELHKLKLEYEFEAAKLGDEHAFEREKVDRQTKLQAGTEYARQILEYALQHDRHLKDYGQMALRSVFLLNGGAIIALLTFSGSVTGKQVSDITIKPASFVVAFSCFAVGLVCAVLAMTFAYLNYMGHKHTTADPGALANNMIAQKDTWPSNLSVGNSRFVNWTWRCALIVGIAAIVFFGLGCFQVGLVFHSLK